jgi:hypothetical protein
MDIFLAIVLGSLFGIALYIAGASNPSKLTAMLRLKYITLMKIIVFAIGFASVLLSLANLFGLFDEGHFNIKAMNLGVVVGGLIFGIGFGWAGTCPGTCVAASTGVGFRKAFAAIIGGLLGAFCFSLMYGWWDKTGIFTIANLGKTTLFRISDKYQYLLPGSFWGLLLVGILFMIGAILLPNKNDIFSE